MKKIIYAVMTIQLVLLGAAFGEGQLDEPFEIITLEAATGYDNAVYGQPAQADNLLVLLPDACFFTPKGPKVATWVADTVTPGAVLFNKGNVSTEPISRITKIGQEVNWFIMPASTGTLAVEVYIEADAATAGADLIVRIGDSYSNQFTVVESDGTSPQPWGITAASITAAGVSTSAVQYVTIKLANLNGSAKAGNIHKIKLTGSPLNNGYLVNTRYRPKANHCSYKSLGLNASGLAAKMWVVENKPDFTNPNPEAFYSPMTTGFGYYGSALYPVEETPENDFTASAMNFSMWSWGSADPEPPQLKQSHLLSLGNPGHTFGSFTHEGSGVKPEGNSGMFPDPKTNHVLALRYEPDDLQDSYTYKTYEGYYFDNDSEEWKFYAAGRKYKSGLSASDNVLNMPGSFVEVPGVLAVERTGHTPRTMDVRGWVQDVSGTWHQIDMITSNDPSTTTPWPKKFDSIGNGWHRMSTGGIIQRLYDTGSISLTNTYSGPLPAYMNSTKLMALQTEPCLAELNSVEIHDTSGNLLLDFTLTGVDEDTEVKLYYGNNDALTLFQEANEWDNSMTVGANFAPGTYQVVIDAANLPGLTSPSYCRILAKCSKGRYWSRETTTSIPVSGSYAPEVFFNPIQASSGAKERVYAGSLASYAADLDGDAVTFSKIDGPAWLVVATNGTLSGTPSANNVGMNSWNVEVDDGNGGTDQAVLQIEVGTSVAISINFTAGDSHSDIEAAESTGMVNSTNWINTAVQTNNNVDGTTVDIIASKSFTTVAADRDAGTPDGTDGFLALYDAGIRFADTAQTITISDLTAFMADAGASEYRVIAYYKSALNVVDPSINITTAASFTASDLYITADKNFGAAYGFIEAGSGDSNYIIFDGLTADTTTVRFKRGNRDQVVTGIQIEALSMPSVFYETWVGGYTLSGNDTALFANPDEDSANNLTEYALGGLPNDGTNIGYIPEGTVMNADGTNYLEYVYAQRNDAAVRGLTYSVECSTNLVSNAWTNGNIEVVGVGILDAEFNSVTNRVPATENQEFIRLRIEL